jgi:hypothetical protein
MRKDVQHVSSFFLTPVQLHVSPSFFLETTFTVSSGKLPSGPLLSFLTCTPKRKISPQTLESRFPSISRQVYPFPSPSFSELSQLFFLPVLWLSIKQSFRLLNSNQPYRSLNQRSVRDDEESSDPCRSFRTFPIASGTVFLKILLYSYKTNFDRHSGRLSLLHTTTDACELSGDTLMEHETEEIVDRVGHDLDVPNLTRKKIRRYCRSRELCLWIWRGEVLKEE